MSEPIYRLPPEEMKPQLMLLAEELAESRDWGHGPLQLEECHAITRGEGVKIAVLDTGCDMEHSDLKDRIEVWQDFSGSRTGANDVQGHGTHVASIAAANMNSGGIIGAAPSARLLIGKVLGDQGSGASSWISNGIRWAKVQGAHIISMSLGGPSQDAVIASAVREATQAGIYVVAAAGNEGPREGTVGYPGGLADCICVGASDRENRPASFSSRGQQLDVAAPGVSIRSCYPGGRYAILSGTSMATPYVTGCIALLLSYLKNLNLRWPTPAELLDLLKRNSKDIHTPGFDTATGYGLIQPLALLKVVVPPAPPVPIPPPTPVPAPAMPAYLVAHDVDGKVLGRYNLAPSIAEQSAFLPSL